MFPRIHDHGGRPRMTKAWRLATTALSALVMVGVFAGALVVMLLAKIHLSGHMSWGWVAAGLGAAVVWGVFSWITDVRPGANTKRHRTRDRH